MLGIPTLRMAKFTIDIVSDTVCPWCYVGFKRLNKAIDIFKQRHSDATFEIKWHPYYLNPSAPKVSVDKQKVYEKKFGRDRVAMMHRRLAAVGLQDGIKFAFGGKTGNTRKSHRIIHLAGEKGVQNEVVEQLFISYFEDEKDITDDTVLKEAAVKGGLKPEDVDNYLTSDLGGPQVDKEVADAQLRFIQGVPHFTINGKHELGGAQEPDSFVEIFESYNK
ncbi:hypothetical protein TWF225_005869 [Orbilia oligospora]|uniref:Uncharacterized protein n=1 Tax=Orbilia oligospora TaxID=2813651 RepID=A0A7C8NRT6_ORBOL|nr:hypothetical protein TWF751_004712 [Orbilia oligospora]KAF3184566.1 hypothetical protein TWF225_005869 [Orbilia oligospora]KAF3237740.1 hypothetical protein TWF217_002060 [Orbilia oligospora]KAF3240910.1 hypothetical protein TWF128_011140 [Orbilia oligospora]KAF3288188.1 hypothetical protein TWF132_008006 [Orbilia oligospora]